MEQLFAEIIIPSEYEIISYLRNRAEQIRQENSTHRKDELKELEEKIERMENNIERRLE